VARSRQHEQARRALVCAPREDLARLKQDVEPVPLAEDEPP
jgi:hypothetical protein